MGPSTSALSCDLPPSTELEDIFLHFVEKFEAFPNPSSVVEARITSDELEALTRWFSERWEPGMWCESTWQIPISNKISASRQEMFGALFLIVAAEVCRDISNEEAVWPAVTTVLKANKTGFSALFAAGQPTTACKKAIAAGANKLNLRNLVDRHGSQEYFDTLKLQFGFTLKGAVRKLPDWLGGAGSPIAVKILSGDEPEYSDLKSSSFTKLWKTLRDFRSNRISEEYTTAILQSSPWIRHHWTAELLGG